MKNYDCITSLINTLSAEPEVSRGELGEEEVETEVRASVKIWR